MPNAVRRGLPLLLTVFLLMPVIACNAGSTGIDTISQAELISQIKSQQSPLIIDVRTKREYDAGHIPGAINIEFRELKSRISEIESYKNASVVVYCEHGIRAKVAENTLEKANFKSILHLQGDMSQWRKNSLPTSSKQ